MSLDYAPKRFSARWNKGAPAYVLDVLDNGGKTADRYTVLMTCGRVASRRDASIQCLGMSDAPTHPQGVSMWDELTAHDAAAYRYRSGHHRKAWLDLPEHIRAHVIARAESREYEPGFKPWKASEPNDLGIYAVVNASGEFLCDGKGHFRRFKSRERAQAVAELTNYGVDA